MSQYAAPIEVLQAALGRIGEQIVSLDDGSAPALVAAANYEGIVRAMLTKHAWLFATRTDNLTFQETIELGPWTSAFVYPTDVINIRYVMISGCRLERGDYEIQGNRILTRAGQTAELQAVVTFRAGEELWPDDVAEAIVVRMQALFLEALLDRWQDARLKQKDAEAAMQMAIVRDKRQQPGARGDNAPLAQTWRGWTRRYVGRE